MTAPTHLDPRLILNHRLAGLAVEAKALALVLRLKAGFRPDQPRVPLGNPGGGRWTDTGGLRSGAATARRSPPTRAEPAVYRPQPGSRSRFSIVQVARRRGAAASLRINGRQHNLSPAEQALVAVSRGKLEEALKAVRRLDPAWKPTPQAYESVSGYIRANEYNTQQAHARLFQILHPKIGVGPFVRRWIEAPNSGRPLRKDERELINRFGREDGCHRCGTREPGTRTGNFVGDHQRPKSMGDPTAIYPHCIGCSRSQGGYVKGKAR